MPHLQRSDSFPVEAYVEFQVKFVEFDAFLVMFDKIVRPPEPLRSIALQVNTAMRMVNPRATIKFLFFMTNPLFPPRRGDSLNEEKAFALVGHEQAWLIER